MDPKASLMVFIASGLSELNGRERVRKGKTSFPFLNNRWRIAGSRRGACKPAPKWGVLLRRETVPNRKTCPIASPRRLEWERETKKARLSDPKNTHWADKQAKNDDDSQSAV